MVDLLESPKTSRAEPAQAPSAAMRDVLTPKRLGFVAIAAVLVLAYVFWPSQRGGDDTSARGGRGRDQAVSVATAVAKTADLPIRLRSIGWVQPVATVSVISRLNTQIAEQHVVEGQMVAKGELLFRLDDREIRATIARDEATLARDQALAARAEADRKRGAELVARGFLTKQTQDQREADAKAAAATVKADQAALAADRVQLTYTEIRAPIAGRVGAVAETPGNLVRTTDTTPLVTITQMKPVWLSFSLPERELAALRAAMAQTGSSGPGPTVRAMLSGQRTVRATGQLTFLDNSVDQTSGTIAVKATMPNEDAALWPGQYLDVEIVVGVRAKAVVVPTVAVQAGQDGSFVYVVQADNKVQVRKIQVAGSDGELSAVASGLKTGERVVTEGQQRLDDGMRVRTGDAAGGQGRRDGARPARAARSIP